MNENINSGTNPEETKKQQEKEDFDYLADYLLRHPESVISLEDLREAGPEILELEEMFISFESKYSLEELNSIINLIPKDAPNHPVREPAKIALVPIVTKMNIIKKETNISPEKQEELKVKYMKLSRAVGIINNNKVDHNR